MADHLPLQIYHVYRFVSVKVTTQAMIAVGVHLAITDQTAAYHKFFLEDHLLLILMMIGKILLKSFSRRVLMIQVMWLL